MNDIGFFQAYFLWRDAMASAVIAAALCGYLGVFVVLRRMAFVSAALSQVSGLGVALSFFIGSFFGIDPHGDMVPWMISPIFLALLLSCVASMFLALPGRVQRVANRESLVALAYLAASASVVLVLASPRIVQEAHEVGELLFGSAVAVREQNLLTLAVAAVVVAITHGILFKDFVFVSFDGETARSIGYPVARLEAVLNLSIAVTVAMATRALGTLPVFAFLVLPAGAALLFTKRMRFAILFAVGIAILSAVFGYYLSFVYQLPTGPTMAALCAVAWIPAALARRR
jgi:zinc transport system permease protein